MSVRFGLMGTDLSANKGVESPSLAASESRYIEELEILNVAYTDFDYGMPNLLKPIFQPSWFSVLTLDCRGR